jgi:hypothetical protein
LSSRRRAFGKHLTPTPDDVGVDRDRMSKFRDVVARLRLETVDFMSGEHGSALDRGAVYELFFGPRHYALDHNGLHAAPHIGMPAWRALLSERDVLDAAAAVTALGTQPPAAGAERRRLQAVDDEAGDPAGRKEEP